MTTAILYIRVSTDEQAIKGYSLRVQEERLQRFCVANNIVVLKVVKEDHSDVLKYVCKEFFEEQIITQNRAFKVPIISRTDCKSQRTFVKGGNRK